MMKECKHKNIVAYFGSYHRYVMSIHLWTVDCCGLVGGLTYVEFNFNFYVSCFSYQMHVYASEY